MKPLRVALIGNPNSGKTSLYNYLSGEKQKTGNFSGVTVERRSVLTSFKQQSIELVDLPGTYSLFSTSPDEQVVFSELFTTGTEPDLAVVVIDKTMLRRSFFLLTQVMDLGIPCIVAFNMVEAANKAGIDVNLNSFKKHTGLSSIEINARNGKGIDNLKSMILEKVNTPKSILNEFIFDRLAVKPDTIEKSYASFLYQTHHAIRGTVIQSLLHLHKEEIINRYKHIDQLLSEVGKETQLNPQKTQKNTIFADKILLHNFGGYIILISILFLVFQAVYTFAAYPMEWIDSGIASLTSSLSGILPEGPLSSLLTEGIISGIGGVLIFIPQIVFLFLILSIMEESGYMSRVVFLMDRIMTKFGMSGRSIVPLVSASACAIPAIMSTRSIDNWKERLITIFVAPFISCSARLPVYAVLIALAIPDIQVLGIFNLKGIIFLGLYLLGILAAFLSALAMKLIFQPENKSFLMMELPQYRWPHGKKIVATVIGSAKTFVLEAGKIILAISIILWTLASYGPGNNLEQAAATAEKVAVEQKLSTTDTENLIHSYELEASYAGIMGKWMEPAIRPLGYDWKIGIALVSSFAAREVFVGTLATIYSVTAEEDTTLIEQMRQQKRPGSNEPIYTLATSLSLLLFYVFAMQCMSTIAIVKKETNGWKWPIIQLIYMTGLAYSSAFICYQWLS